MDGCGLEEASCECYWAIRLTSSALISILFWRTGRSRTTTEGSRRPLAAGRADGTPGVYVPNNSFPGLGTVHRTMQFSQRTYRKYGVRSITRRCVSCPQVAHGARWTRSRRRSIGVPVSVACSGFRGPSGSMCVSGKCEDKNDGGAKSVPSLLWLGNRDLGTAVRGIRQRRHGERQCSGPRVAATGAAGRTRTVRQQETATTTIRINGTRIVAVVTDCCPSTGPCESPQERAKPFLVLRQACHELVMGFGVP